MPLPFIVPGGAINLWPVTNLVGASYLLTQAPIQDAYSADFPAGGYIKLDQAQTLGDMVSVANTTGAMAEYVDGTWQAFAANTPRVTDRGWWLETTSTNYLRNNSGTGSAAPSTFPTNWTQFTGAGVSWTVGAVGTSNGLPYVPLRLAGTTSTTSGANLRFDTATAIAAVVGDVFTYSIFIALEAGALAPATIMAMDVVQFAANGSTSTGTLSGTNIISQINGTLQRFTRTFTVTNGSGTTAFIQPRFGIAIPTAAAVDFTLRFAGAQVEKRSGVSSVILTTNAAVTRAGDTGTAKLPALPARDLSIATTSYAGSASGTQIFSGVPGADYTINPSALDRPLVTRIDWGSV